jgi:hypothetical protein
MATPQLSPGVLVREVDLTVGRADNVLDNIGAIAGPFAIGPVNEPVDIATEQQLINTFGKPSSTDAQYEYWMSASSFLSYGGVLKVVRTGSSNSSYLINANAGVNSETSPTLKIDNYDDYSTDHINSTDFTFAAKTPGSWANNLKVCVIDDLADQTIGITTANPQGMGIQVGMGVTTSLTGVVLPGAGTTSVFTGYLKGIITGVNQDATNGNSTIDVKIVSRVASSTTQYNTTLVTASSQEAVAGVSTIYLNSTAGLTTLDVLTAPGLNNLTIASVASTSVTVSTGIAVTINSGVAVTFSRLVTIGGAETPIDYSENSSFAAFKLNDTISVVNSTGISTANFVAASVSDWYNNQTLGLTNSTVYWKSIAPKPTTNQYSLDRNGRNDGIHVVVIDDVGTITGVQGSIIEKHTSLSKAIDSISAVNSPQKIWYEQYLADFSSQIYAGGNPSSGPDSHHNTTPKATGFSSGFVGFTTTQGLWGQNAQNVTFSAIGNKTYTLKGGKDYGDNGGMQAKLGDLVTSYRLFANKDEVAVDYLIMGPGLLEKSQSQAKAQELISIASARKDCVAVISPHREDVVDRTNTEDQTNEIIEFFSPLSSSSYAVFDSGYKYTYDRFNNRFRYIPCNPDIAGLMVRTSINSYPWYSPAGQQRGVLNNAIKLAYNPTKAQRDRIYPLRINSIVNQPGVGIILFGDKTALGYASAFDRINVRRLFLTVEQALERTAQAQLFELNDPLTRANFINIVEPYLRDIQAKRGVYDFRVICDETNNTPDVIDNNEFRADIFLKPTKSINYVTLTFVATRTGVSFEEVTGRV